MDNGGFSVVETANAEDNLRDRSTWSTYLTFEVYPVVDSGDATPITDAGIQAREAAG